MGLTDLAGTRFLRSKKSKVGYLQKISLEFFAKVKIDIIPTNHISYIP
ncbi:hypothetical protein HYW94_03765 [Candidatus Uhrbacteria bacterium]|nr:hypothetical protein [Candidatus Uhrbacteria bacterium]